MEFKVEAYIDCKGPRPWDKEPSIYMDRQKARVVYDRFNRDIIISHHGVHVRLGSSLLTKLRDMTVEDPGTYIVLQEGQEE